MAWPDLTTDGRVLVDGDIKQDHAALDVRQSKDGAGLVRPADVRHLAAQAVEEDGPTELSVPQEYSGLGGAGEEEVGVERIPDNLVDWSHVDAVGHQELGGEFCGAKMNLSLLGSYQELGVQVWLEGDTSDPVDQSLLELLQESEIRKRNNSDSLTSVLRLDWKGRRTTSVATMLDSMMVQLVTRPSEEQL